MNLFLTRFYSAEPIPSLPHFQIGFENDSNLRTQIRCENIAKMRFGSQFAVFYFFETFHVTEFSEYHFYTSLQFDGHDGGRVGRVHNAVRFSARERRWP